jgi:excisionase family DNA binding protein
MSPSPSPGPQLLLSYTQAARALGVCERTVRNMVRRGELAIVKLGKRSLFDVEDLKRVVQDNKVKGDPST